MSETFVRRRRRRTQIGMVTGWYNMDDADADGSDGAWRHSDVWSEVEGRRNLLARPATRRRRGG